MLAFILALVSFVQAQIIPNCTDLIPDTFPNPVQWCAYGGKTWTTKKMASGLFFCNISVNYPGMLAVKFLLIKCKACAGVQITVITPPTTANVLKVAAFVKPGGKELIVV